MNFTHMRTRLSVISALSASAAFLPLVASAQTLLNTLALFSQFLNSLVYLAITAAILAFFWGLIRYLFNNKGGDDKKQGLEIMMYGILALFVMVSIWGIIQLLQRTFGVTNNQAIIPQTIQINPGGFR